MATVFRSEVKLTFTCPVTNTEVTAVDWNKTKDPAVAEFTVTPFLGGCCGEHEYAELEFDIKCTCGETHGVI